MFSKSFLFAGAALIAVPALAQEAAPAAAPTPSWAPEIIVTAQRGSAYALDAASVTRTDVPLLNTPQSIQVLTRTLLEEQQVTTLADALSNVSGVVAARPYEAVLVQPILRGFNSQIFVDGLPAFGATAVVDPSSLAGVERIEVAKGPTATLFGGGLGAPVGGLINIVTKTPQDTARYAAAVRTGSFGTANPSWDLNQPFGENAGVRFAGEYLSGSDYIDDVGTQRLSLNPSLRLNFGPDTEVVLVGNYSKIEQREYSGLPAAVIGLPGVDPFQFSGARDAPRTVIENAMFTGTLTHSFSEAISGTLQYRHYGSSFDEIASFIFPRFFPPVGTAYPLIRAYLPTTVSENTVDASLTFNFNTGRVAHVLVAGFQYDGTHYDAALAFDFTPIGIVDYARPQDNNVQFGAVPVIDPATSLIQNDQYTTIAGYVQDQLSIGNFNLLASLRVTNLQYQQIAGGTADESYTKVNPRIGATYDIAKGVSLFVGWATGFRGTVGFIGREPPVPETSNQIEGGIKFAMANGLSGTISGYRINRQNVPTADPANPFLQIQTGEQRSTGFETDLVWEPSPSWSVLAAYAYTDAVVTADTSIPLGDRLARVPQHAGRLAVRYRVLDGSLSGFGVGAGVTAASSSQLTLPNTETVDGYATVDLQASYQWRQFSIGVNVQNLFNSRYFLPYQYLALPVAIAGQPRSAFVTFGVRL